MKRGRRYQGRYNLADRVAPMYKLFQTMFPFIVPSIIPSLPLRSCFYPPCMNPPFRFVLPPCSSGDTEIIASLRGRNFLKLKNYELNRIDGNEEARTDIIICLDIVSKRNIQGSEILNERKTGSRLLFLIFTHLEH